MVAALFPETGAVAIHEFDALQPFGAFPEVIFRNNRAHRATMIARDLLPFPFIGEQNVGIGEIGQSQIGRVAIMAVKHYMRGGRFWLHDRQQMRSGDPLPMIIEARPGGNAVNVGDVLKLGLRQEILKTPLDRCLDQAIDRERPFPCLDLWLDPKVENRPVLDLMLPGGQAIQTAIAGLAGDQAAFVHPFFLLSISFCLI